MDPNHRDFADEVKGFFRKAFGRNSDRPANSTYGSCSNIPGGSQTATYQTSQQGVTPVSFAAAPPPRDLLGRMQQDISWSGKKPSAAVDVKAQSAPDTPAAKLLKVSGGRALPTNGELNAFKGALTPDSLVELKFGLLDSDWKVKVRAIAGLECYGEKFGFGPVADQKSVIEGLKQAPQTSLRSNAARFYEAIKDVEPSVAPSAFDLEGGDAEAVEEHVADDEKQMIDFGSEID
jgi:hypothetical protein